MSAVSFDQFSSKLDEELVWRRKELSDLKSAIKDAPDVSRPALVRSLIPMLYAHWEGFAIKLGTDYLGYIAKRKLPYSELDEHFLRLSYLKRLDALSMNSVSIENRLGLLEDFVKSRTLRFSNVPKDVVDSGSNLNSERTKNLCVVCGVSSKFVESRSRFLDVELLKRRNQIAHGEWATIEFSQIDDMVAKTLELMTCFRTEIENALISNSFRASVGAVGK